MEDKQSTEPLADAQFAEKLADFFRDLASKQEPLLPEFQEVLAKNFWDLIVRT